MMLSEYQERFNRGAEHTVRTPFQHHLYALQCCFPARNWVAGKTLRQAWSECDNPHWMDYFVWSISFELGSSGVDRLSRLGEALRVRTTASYLLSADKIRELFPVEELASYLNMLAGKPK